MSSQGSQRSVGPTRLSSRQKRAPSPERGRRTLSQVACKSCREKKTKCDGDRPHCSRCQILGIACCYDVDGGITRAERFKILKSRQLTRTANLERFVELLQTGNDVEASTVLARLRLGDRIEDILQVSPAGSDQNSPQPQLGQRHTIVDSTSESGTEQDVHSVVPEGTNEDFLTPLIQLEDLRLDATPAVHVREEETDTTLLVAIPRQQSRATPSFNATLKTDIQSYQPWNGDSTTTACFTNLFRNLPMSSSILANHYPQPIQEHQIRRLSIPFWSMSCVHRTYGGGYVTSALTKILRDIAERLNQGGSWEALVGNHPHVAASSDPSSFDTAPLLCQWAARLARGLKDILDDFTFVACMSLNWYLGRWLLSPSPESYAEMPSYLRPTPYQIFVPHSHLTDFVLWPKLRDVMIQRTNPQEFQEWFSEAATSLRCDWPHSLERAFRTDDKTGEVFFTDEAKATIFDLSNWSVGPGVRAHLPNTDLYCSIRPHNG